MKLDIKTVKPVYSKIDPQVIDPVRYPKVILPYEKQMKKSFADSSNLMISKLTQNMVEMVKK